MNDVKEALQVALYVVINEALMRHELPSFNMDREDDPQLYDAATLIELLAEAAGYIEWEDGDHLIATTKGRRFLKDNAYLILAEQIAMF